MSKVWLTKKEEKTQEGAPAAALFLPLECYVTVDSLQMGQMLVLEPGLGIGFRPIASPYRTPASPALFVSVTVINTAPLFVCLCWLFVVVYRLEVRNNSTGEEKVLHLTPEQASCFVKA